MNKPSEDKSSKPEFDQYADQYQDLMRDTIRDRFVTNMEYYVSRKWLLLRDYLAANGRDIKHQSLLDLGCGQLDFLRMVHPHAASVAGCDVSSNMIQNCGDLDVRHQQTSTTIPFETASFDLVTAICVFHHVQPPDRPPLLAEIRRVLKPGGLFCLFEHNPLNPVVQYVIRRVPIDADAVLLWPRPTRALLRGNGFEPLEHQYYLYLPEKLYSRFSFVENLLARVPGGGQYALFAHRP